MVRDTVPSILRVPASEDGEAIQFLGKAWAQLGEVDAGNGGSDDTERTADTIRGERFGVERIVMARAALCPDENALNVFGGLASVGHGSRRIEEGADGKPGRGSGCMLQPLATVDRQGVLGIGRMKQGPWAGIRSIQLHAILRGRDACVTSEGDGTHTSGVVGKWGRKRSIGRGRARIRLVNSFQRLNPDLNLARKGGFRKFRLGLVGLRATCAVDRRQASQGGRGRLGRIGGGGLVIERRWYWGERKRVPCKNPCIDGLAANELFLDEAFHPIFGHAAVPETFGVDDEDGSSLAYAEAAGFGSEAGVGSGRQGDLSILEDAFEFAPCGFTSFLRAAGIADAEKDVADEVTDFEFCGDGLQWGHDRNREWRGLKTGGTRLELKNETVALIVDDFPCGYT
jgi:hypothetical protein